MLKKIFFVLTILNSIFVNAQTKDECYIDKEFVIILSSKNYAETLKFATEAAKKLNIKLDLRNLIPCQDTNLGLTFLPAICIEETKDYEKVDSTCYLARGRFDDGVYVSIEYSSAYLNFKEGYYIVIIASGEKNDATLKATLANAKIHYKDAYRKSSKVYMCCMH